MADKNLGDDMVKLVEYTIVSIERGKEEIVESGHKLFDDDMTGDAFASWVIAEEVPKKKNGYDSKYLRVSYNVLDRWPRQDLKYEERQLEILGQIEKKIK